MEYDFWMKKAKDAVNNLQTGSEFTLKELFQGFEWEQLSKGNRIALGKYFKNEVKCGKVDGVIYIAKNSNNSSKYMKKL